MACERSRDAIGGSKWRQPLADLNDGMESQAATKGQKRRLILLRHKRLEGADSETAGAAWESVGECGGDASSERGDGEWDVALGAQGRIVRVRDRGKRKMFGRARRGDVLRGESSALRRSGIRERRCTAWRDGGSS